MGWVNLFLQLVPGLVGLFGDDKANKATEAGVKAIETIKNATGATTPEEAKAKIDQNPQLSDDLKIKLAQIAADAEEQKRQADLAALKAKLDDQEKARQAEAAERDKQRQADLDALSKRIEDVKNARGTFQALASAGSKFAWGAPIVSAIVTIGFFTILILVIEQGFGAVKDQQLQVLNVILGTLATAFTTVVTFWVGSAQGSRNKDEATFQLLSQQSQQAVDTAKAQNETTLQVAKQQVAAAAAQQPAAPAAAKKKNNFDRCIDVILKWEGGFTNDPQDRGGATNWGITIGELKIWREDQNLTADDVRNLKKEDAIEIFRTNYWNKMRCDDLAPGVDLVVFDFGVNAGIGRSAKMLQNIVGAEQDGSIGPATVAAAGSQDPVRVIKTMTEKRLAYYQSLSGWDHFGRGWTNRTNDVGQIALQMAAG